MSEWVLILLFIGINAGGATSVDGFSTKEDCEYSADRLKEIHRYHAFCVEVRKGNKG